MYFLRACAFLVFEHIVCSFHTLWILFLCLLCTLAPPSWSIWILFSMSPLRACAFFMALRSRLLRHPHGFPFFYIFFARFHLLRGPAHPIFTPDFMDSLSSSSSPRSSSIQCRRIPYTKFLMTLPLLSSFSFFSPVLFGARMLIHACCRLPLPLQGLRLVRWILQNFIILALFYLPISHGSSSRVFLVSF